MTVRFCGSLSVFKQSFNQFIHLQYYSTHIMLLFDMLVSDWEFTNDELLFDMLVSDWEFTSAQWLSG